MKCFLKCYKKGFTVTKLVVIMAVVAILVVMGMPHFLGRTQPARQTVLLNDAKIVDNSLIQLIASRDSLPAGGVAGITESVYTVGGDVGVTGPTVNPTEAALNSGEDTQTNATVQPSNADVRGAIYESSDPLVASAETNGPVTADGAGDATITTVTEDRLTSTQGDVTLQNNNQPPEAVITMTPSTAITTTSFITWGHWKSNPHGSSIVFAEWQNQRESYEPGTHTVGLRVMNAEGIWSEWTHLTFTVHGPPVAVITMTPPANININTPVVFSHNTWSEPGFVPITLAEWQHNNGPITLTPPNGTFALGNHTVRMRVRDASTWSAWTSVNFDVGPPLLPQYYLFNDGLVANYPFTDGISFPHLSGVMENATAPFPNLWFNPSSSSTTTDIVSWINRRVDLTGYNRLVVAFAGGPDLVASINIADLNGTYYIRLHHSNRPGGDGSSRFMLISDKRVEPILPGQAISEAGMHDLTSNFVRRTQLHTRSDLYDLRVLRMWLE